MMDKKDEENLENIDMDYNNWKKKAKGPVEDEDNLIPSRNTSYESIAAVFESCSETETTSSVAEMPYSITADPTVIFFNKQKGPDGKDHLRPLRLPLRNASFKKIKKVMPVYRKMKDLTFDERRVLELKQCDPTNSDSADLNDEDELFEVKREVLVHLLQGTISVKRKDPKTGEIIKEIHKAGFEYPSELKYHWMPNAGLFDNNYYDLENYTPVRKAGYDERSEACFNEIIWKKGLIAKFSEPLENITIKHRRPKIKKTIPPSEKEKRFDKWTEKLIYTTILNALINRSNQLERSIKKYAQKDIFADYAEFKSTKNRRLLLRTVMQFKDIRDKFIDSFVHSVKTLEKVLKRLKSRECESSKLFQKLTLIEEKIMANAKSNKQDKQNVIKQIITKMYEDKLLEVSMLKKQYSDHLQSMFRLSNVMKENNAIMQGHEAIDFNDFHYLYNLKRKFRGDLEESNKKLNQIKGMHKFSVRETQNYFEDIEQYLQVISPIDTEEVENC